MATPAERKALLFFGIVAMLGAGVRVWQARPPASTAARSDTYSPDSARSGSPRPVRSSSSRKTLVRKATSASKTGQINRDSNAIVDLDRATMTEIDAIGVMPKGLARLIVADRDSFGPFGSVDELRRVPFLSASTLRKLAPRVTFSRVPRPRNTVVHPRTPLGASARRKAERQP